MLLFDDSCLTLINPGAFCTSPVEEIHWWETAGEIVNLGFSLGNPGPNSTVKHNWSPFELKPTWYSSFSLISVTLQRNVLIFFL